MGRRRDGGVRQIRSDGAQRYPGVDVPGVHSDSSDSYFDGDSRRLAPALDTGIAVQTRTDRAQANAGRRRRLNSIIAVAVLILLVSGAVGWRYVSDRLAAANPLANLGAASIAGDTGGTPATAKAGSAGAIAAATPIFATYKTVKLHLPVPMLKLTEVGFHQASYAWALPMKTPMKTIALSAVFKTKSTGRDRAAEPSGPNAVMTGYVIRMWRARPGRPDTAADIGALAGTTVLSPVTGTVVRIKSYKLYRRYPDYEMHIIADGTSGLDIVMIHLTDLSCTVGQHVEAGVTPIAKVRKLSDKFHDQLADYTQSPGDHVHLQINDSNYRGYKGLLGAVDPSTPDSGTAVAD